MSQTIVDTSGLNRGLELAQQFTSRTPARACNIAGLVVARAAQKGTPAVTVPVIDAELAVVKAPSIGKRGKPIKRKRFKGQAGTALIDPKAVLAILVVQARAKAPGKNVFGRPNYNLRTNSRYAGPSPFKGVSREAGRAAMAIAVHEMIAARHKSGSFLRAGWGPAIRILVRKGADKFASAVMPFTTDFLIQPYDFTNKLGDAHPASEGSVRAVCTIENDIGYEGKNKESFDRAIQTYGVPALQSAVDGEGQTQMQYYLTKAYEKELVGPFNAAAGRP